MSRLKMLQIIQKPLRPLKASANFSINYTFETPDRTQCQNRSKRTILDSPQREPIMYLHGVFNSFDHIWVLRSAEPLNGSISTREVRRLFRTNWAVSLTHTQSIRSVQAGWWWGRWWRLGNSIRVIIRSITSSSRSLSHRSWRSGKQLLPFSTVKCEL